MAERVSVQLEQHQREAISDMVDRGIADNESEAHRMCLNAGKREFGYKNGHYTETSLLSWLTQAAYLLTMAGLVGLAFTFAYPVGARIPSFAVIVVGVSIQAFVVPAVEKREPKVTKRLKGLLGGETA
jgi:hypothetical protein